MSVLSPSQTEIFSIPPVASWGRTHVKVIRLSYTFLINNFRCLPNEVGQPIMSSTFSSCAKDEIQWRLVAYTNGMDEESKGYIGIFLQLVSAHETKVRLKYAFSYLDSNQEKKGKVVASASIVVQGEARGFPQFLKRDFVLNTANGLLINDRFTICCDVYAVSDIIHGQTIPAQLKIPESRLSGDMRKLFESHMFSDVILMVNEHELHAHKNVLAARSPIFGAMFEHKKNETMQSRVYITDIDYETLKEMLVFIYTGNVPNLGENAADLMAAANKYALDGLKVICEKTLFSNLLIENAADNLVLSDLYNATQLKTHVIDFIVLHAADVIITNSWKIVEQLHPHLITEVLMDFAVQNKGYNLDLVRKCTFTWVIDNFSFCVENDVFYSCPFSPDENSWCLAFMIGDQPYHVFLYLKLLTWPRDLPLKTKFEFSILDAALENVIHDEAGDKIETFDVIDINHMECVRRGFTLNESDGLLANDKLIVRCDLTVLPLTINTSSQDRTVEFNVPACDLSDDFKQLFEDQKFCDVTLNVNGQELYAHKNVLSARSPIFAAMFQHEMEETKHNRVDITDVDHEVLKEMLRFIYTGNAPNLGRMSGDLLAAAHKYALERLKVMCEQTMFLTLGLSNACDFLILADMHGSDQFKACVIDFMTFNFRAIVDTSSWKTLEKHHAHLLTEVCGALAKQLDISKCKE